MDKFTAHAELNHPDGIYKVGENAVCTVNFYKNEKIFPCRIRCIAKVENNIVIDRSEEYRGETLAFEIRSESPAWIYFSFQILDPVTGEPMSGENLWKHSAKPTVVEDIGAIFDPERISHPVRPPEDFKEFWMAQLGKLDQVPLNPVVKELPVPEKYQGKLKFYDVRLDIIDGEKATGYLAVPVNAKPKSCPVYMWFLSWCWTDTLPEMALEQAAKGAVAFSATWHGFPLGQPESYYEEKHKDFDSWKGVENRDTWIMRYIYFRTLQAMRYMKTMPEWNGKDFIIQGGSLAGSECIVGAALDKSVTLALISVPAFNEYETCGLRRLNLPLCDRPVTTPEIRKAAEYYASANFTPMITCETCFCTGFVDTLCPPSSVYASYNALPAAARKTIYTDPRTGHYGTTPNVPGNNRLNEYLDSFNVQKYTD